VSGKLEYLPAEEGFLDPVRAGGSDAGAALAVVIPFGLEASVSYGAGTSAGPAAILRASQQLELYDDELECEPYLAYGVETLREPVIAKPIEAALEQIAALVEAVLEEDKFPLVLGGEHALTAGAIRPLVRRHPDLAVLHLDAHADLRDGYQGERFSHAAAMRRVLDHAGVSLVSVGIRAISKTEVEFYTANRDRVAIYLAKDRVRWDVAEILARLRGRPVYVTFDIDVLDASVMPATGTPTPGGLSYVQALEVLRAVCQAGRVVGADLVEFAPISGLHACDYTAAALAYKLLSYALSLTGSGSS
jgi:agmatinase